MSWVTNLAQIKFRPAKTVKFLLYTDYVFQDTESHPTILFEEFTMKKLLSTLISAAFLATPMMVISAPAAAQSVMPTATGSNFKFEAKHHGKKTKKSKSMKKAA